MFKSGFLAFLLLCVLELAQSQDLPHKAFLDPNGVFQLSWDFDETHITFEMEVQTTGWVGIGFSQGSGMINADIYAGWVKDGTAFITDRHGPTLDQGFPPIDVQQNVDLVSGSENNGTTTIRFSRLLAGCDEEGMDKEITGDTMSIIYAWNDQDPEGDDLSGYHGLNRGTKPLLLLDPNGKDDSVLPPGETHQSFDLLNDNFLIPAVDSYYNCKMFKIPELDTKHHLVKIEPVIQPGNELQVHHMLLYQCAFPDKVNDTAIGSETECYGSNMPGSFADAVCTFSIHAWAVGGGVFYFPNHVGLPLGTTNSPKYVVLETHYDNPLIKPDIIDSSGLRLTYTPDLRTYDAGVMGIGHAITGFTDIIPPGLNTFLDYGECSAQCLTAGMDSDQVNGITVFAVLLHSHLLGKGLTLKHVRNGTELAPLAKDQSYDFNYQETRTLRDERRVERGDAMQVVCNYHSLDKTEITVGGLSTTQEMCYAFVYYYPSLSLGVCETSPEFQTFMAYLGFISYEVSNSAIYNDISDVLVLEPEEYANKTGMQILNERTWNEVTGKQFSDDVKMMKRMQNCLELPFKQPPGVDNHHPALVIDHPYVDQPANCFQPEKTSTIGQIETTSDASILDCQTFFVVVMALASLAYY